MNTIRLVLCVLFPPLAVFLTGRMGSFILSIFLSLLFWLPGVLHAFFVVIDFHNERRLYGFKPMSLP